jgi:hypothetical protein
MVTILTRRANLIWSSLSFFSSQPCHRRSSNWGVSVTGGKVLGTACVSGAIVGVVIIAVCTLVWFAAVQY